MKILILSCNTGEGHNSCARLYIRASWNAREIGAILRTAGVFINGHVEIRIWLAHEAVQVFPTALRQKGMNMRKSTR